MTNIEHRDIKILGKAGITFGRQIGAYPILIGVPYLIPLETQSDILITGHGMRSISGIETGLNINKITQNQLSAIPGLGRKGAWKIVSKRANKLRKDNEKFTSIYDAFKSAEVNMPEFAEKIFVVE